MGQLFSVDIETSSSRWWFWNLHSLAGEHNQIRCSLFKVKIEGRLVRMPFEDQGKDAGGFEIIIWFPVRVNPVIQMLSGHESQKSHYPYVMML